MHNISISNKNGVNATFEVDNPKDTITILEKAKELAKTLEQSIPGPWGLQLNQIRIEF